MKWNEALSHAFADNRPEELASFLERLDAVDLAAYLQTLPIAKAASLFTRLSPNLSSLAYRHLDPTLKIEILEASPINVSGALLRRLTKEEGSEYLGKTSKPRHDALRQILSYQANSAGGLMDSNYPVVMIDATAALAIAGLRGHERHGITDIYAIDREHKLQGSLASSDLMLSNPRSPIRKLVTPAAAVLSPFTNARSLIENPDLIRRRVLPVATEDNVFLGALPYELLIKQFLEDHQPAEDTGREDSAKALGKLYKLGIKSLMTIVEGRGTQTNQPLDPPR